MERLAFNYIRVGFWNCGSPIGKEDFIRTLANNFDVLFLQETHSERVICPGYDYYNPNQWRPTDVEITVLIKNGINHKHVDIHVFRSKDIELLEI